MTRRPSAQPTLRRAAAIAAGAIAWSGTAAGAQPVRFDPPIDRVFIRLDKSGTADPEAPARLARLIDALGSDDFKVRAQADRALFDDAGISLPMIEQELKQRGSALSLDTRLRLTSAAKVRFSESPRAAMGIQFWQNGNLRDRVVIERTFPEFDASRKLEDGDMVVEVDGVTLSGPSARTRFQSVIVARDPGDVIPILVRRGEQKLRLEVRLGGRGELPNASFVDTGMIERAWQVRSAGYVQAGTDPIVPPVKAADWNANPLGGAFRPDRLTARQKGMPGAGPALVGGGMPRGVALDNDAGVQQFAGGRLRRNGQVIINNGMLWLPAQFDPLAQEAGLQPLNPQDELNELVRARAQAAGSVERARNTRRAVLPDGQIVAIQDFVAKDLAMIDKQIAAIRAEMTEAGIPIADPPAASATQDPSQLKPPAGNP